MTTKRKPPVQSFDANGECEHTCKCGPHWIWCLKDECYFCGAGHAL